MSHFSCYAVQAVIKVLAHVSLEYMPELDSASITYELTGLKASMSCSAFFLASSASSYLALIISSCVVMASLAAIEKSFKKALYVTNTEHNYITTYWLRIVFFYCF